MSERVYSVAQVNSYIRNMFAQDFFLPSICVKGEVSNCKYHSSGHIYFTIKDETSAMAAVMFAGKRSGLKFPMKEGDQVLVSGSIEVYERDGRYQLYARKIERDGEGSLYLRFEQLKRELDEMGMFASEYKKTIPTYISRLGVVTASTGAAIQDICNITKRRNPYVQIILYPAKVQGDGAAESVAEGIAALDAYGVDTIIVGRGGGSIEDLWAFNEELVARAIFSCQTPVISAVGHETDTTIADYVADLRAPTPSAAAELAVFDIFEFYNEIESMRRRMVRTLDWKKEQARARSESLQRRLTECSPQHRIQAQKQYSDILCDKLDRNMERHMAEARQTLRFLAGQLDARSPAKKLGQGLAFVTEENGRRIHSIQNVSPGECLNIRLADGSIRAAVTGTEELCLPGAKSERITADGK